MKQLTFIALLASTSVLAQPDFSEFIQTDYGAYYKVDEESGSDRKPVVGDYVRLHLVHSTASDSVIFSTYGGSVGPVEFQLAKADGGGDVMHVLPLVTEGDSITSIISTDSIYQRMMPPYAKPGEWVKYKIRLLSVMNQQEYDAAKLSKEQALIAEQGEEIEARLNAMDVSNYKKTSSGLYYVMDTEGEGNTPVAGQTVKVHYIGTLLNGNKFDSSRDRDQPFSFVLGKGKVIRGWDEGLTLFKIGGRGKLYIPSPLGYGENGAGSAIPPNAILVFDIELLGVSNEGLQLDKDIQIIKAYMHENGITASKATSGILYRVDDPGDGEQVLPGRSVSVHYTGRLLDGTEFDSSIPRGQPFTFQVGTGMVIKGWDLGLRAFRKGGRGTLYIPSPLGYGERGSPPKIPSNAILIFDVEIVDVK